jgi:hypothetical protein
MVRQVALGRIVLRILVGALCVAAAVASLALLRGDFSDTDEKVIATSTLFALTSSMAAAGIGVRERWRALASLTTATAALTFAIVAFGLWVEVDSEVFWRAAGSLAILALECAHVAFILSRLRAGDPRRVVAATRTAAVLAVVSGAMGVAPLAGLLPDGDMTLYAETLGVVLIGQLLGTALAPLLRRLAAGDEGAAMAVPTERERLAAELVAVADRLERLGGGPQVAAETDRLRRLARAASAL